MWLRGGLVASAIEIAVKVAAILRLFGKCDTVRVFLLVQSIRRHSQVLLLRRLHLAVDPVILEHFAVVLFIVEEVVNVMALPTTGALGCVPCNLRVVEVNTLISFATWAEDPVHVVTLGLSSARLWRTTHVLRSVDPRCRLHMCTSATARLAELHLATDVSAVCAHDFLPERELGRAHELTAQVMLASHAAVQLLKKH